MEERLYNHGEVLTLQVLVGERGQGALGMGREAFSPTARLDRRAVPEASGGSCQGQETQRSCSNAQAST